MHAKGSITIYLSMILLLMLGLIFTLLESARVRGLQVDADRMTQAASESTFAEYHQEMLEMYDLLTLDASYGDGTFSAENVSSRMFTFLEQNTQETDGMNFYRIQPQETELTGWQLMTDDDAAAYYELACTYAQSAAAVSAASDLLELLTGDQQSDESEDVSEEIEDVLDALEDESLYSEEVNAELTEAEIEAAQSVSEEKKSILETVSGLKTKGLLALLIEDADDLSEQTLSGTQPASERTLETGTDTLIDGDGSRLLFQWYLGDKFTCFTDDTQNHALQYELEYCYAGKESDLQNLESCAEAILLVREAANYAYLLTDSEKQSEARVVALAITGIFAVPALLTAAEHAVLAAWAFLESVRDLQVLLAGDALPAVKTSSNWMTSLSSGSITGSARSSSSGSITYEQYLQMLLLTRRESKLIERSLDLIEQNIRLTDDNESFTIDSCMAGASWSVAWTGSPLFLSLTPLSRQLLSGEYAFLSEGTFRYQ